FIVKRAVEAEFGTACNDFRVGRVPDLPGWGPVTTMFHAMETLACLLEFAKDRYPENRKKLETYMDALAKAGVIHEIKTTEDLFSPPENMERLRDGMYHAFEGEHVVPGPELPPMPKAVPSIILSEPESEPISAPVPDDAFSRRSTLPPPNLS